jgi:ABC-type phosphate transport system substrate-binding protein
MSRLTQLPRLLCAAVSFAVSQPTWAADIAVIVNPRNPAATLSAQQVSAIFLGKTNTLPSGPTAMMADQPDNGPLYESFYGNVTGKTPPQVRAAWARLTFSGKALPPRPLADGAEVKKFVASHPDAIGYVDKDAVDPSVKVVLVVD